MAVGEICNREVVITERSVSVVDAAKLMRSHHVGDLVVVEEKGAASIRSASSPTATSWWKWWRPG
jgi:predicted transcriptional regulator